MKIAITPNRWMFTVRKIIDLNIFLKSKSRKILIFQR